MPHPEVVTGSSSSFLGKKEQTMLKCASLTTGNVASYNSEIPASMGNSVLCVQTSDNGNMSSVLTG